MAKDKKNYSTPDLIDFGALEGIGLCVLGGIVSVCLTGGAFGTSTCNAGTSVRPATCLNGGDAWFKRGTSKHRWYWSLKADPKTDLPELLSFHASTLILENAAVLFAGDGGAGKSTLSRLFQTNGFRSPGDEVATLFLDNDGFWKLHSVYKKVGEKYDLVHVDDLPSVQIIVFLGQHLKAGYSIEPCSSSFAVKKGVSCLFYYDTVDYDTWYRASFHRICGLVRQTKTVIIDFSKSLDFIPAIRVLLNGDS
jgi:hypothetical protein